MTPQEREVLLTVRNKLADGEIEHHDDAANGALAFDMDTAWGSCGTVACIGGWMAMEMGIEGFDEVFKYVKTGGRTGDLRPLFYPDHDEGGPEENWGLITTDQAVMAIDNFLVAGRPCWAEVINS